MRSRFVLGAFALAGFVACGGDDGGGGIMVVDAPTQQQQDAPVAACAAQADYGSPTPMQQGALRYCATQNALVKCPTTATNGTMGTATDPFMVVYVAQLNAQNDFFSFELWKGAAPFQTKIQPASNINLGDATQSQWKTCSACAYVSAQVNLQSGADMGKYLANAGTANVTTVTLVDNAANTKLAGNLSGVNMQHIDINMSTFESTPSADGCTTKLNSLSFDLAMRDPQMMFTGDVLSDYAWQVVRRAEQRLKAQ